MQTTLLSLLTDPLRFIHAVNGLRLREYQRDVAAAIVRSVAAGSGHSFVVMFPRQSGKNELQAQIEAYLLTLFCMRGAEIVKVSPTWKPQSLNAMRRLQRVLERSAFTRAAWAKENGYIYRVGDARIFFLSGAPEANIVGATASTLLEVDEAQDVSIAKYDRDIAPMAASTNATRVFWGTAWTARTLLARELRAAREAEQRDGIRRAFVLTADEVSREVPDYGRFVAGQVARLGRAHPMVRTQYFSEELDAEGGMFPPERLALITGGRAEGGAASPVAAHPGVAIPSVANPSAGNAASHAEPTRGGPIPGRAYAFLLDVAGEDAGALAEAGELTNPRRDSTALTIVEIDSATLADPVLRAPTYRPAARRQWTGANHTRVYAEVRALAERWQPRHVVVDATGVGAGLASFLARALPGRVVPFLFNQSSKSRLGWDFLTVVDEGRWREDAPASDPCAAEFIAQLQHCQYELLPGPGRVMKWGVPDGTRSPLTGQLVHDDWVLSAALCAVLDGAPARFATTPAGGVIRGKDPLDEMRGF